MNEWRWDGQESALIRVQTNADCYLFVQDLIREFDHTDHVLRWVIPPWANDKLTIRNPGNAVSTITGVQVWIAYSLFEEQNLRDAFTGDGLFVALPYHEGVAIKPGDTVTLVMNSVVLMYSC